MWYSNNTSTLMLDKIYWKNKSIRESSNETHRTNCVLTQQKEDQQLKQEKKPVTTYPNYNCNRKTHRSFTLGKRVSHQY